MTSRPTVFHLITRVLKGGAEGETHKLIEGMDDYRFVLGYGNEALQSEVGRFEQAGARIRQFSMIRHYNPVTAPLAVGQVANFIRKNEVDILHTHSTEAGVIGRLAAPLAGDPAVVHTVHGVPFSDDRNRLLNGYVLGCERLAARFTDRMVTNTDRIRDTYLERGIGTPEQYRTIHSGIDIGQFSDAPPASDVDSEDIRVVMVARLARGKGFEVLLDAIAELQETVHVYIAGEGPLAEWLDEELEHRGLEGTVTLLGFREDIPQVLAAGDLLVLPSYREGMPRVITEAMAAGLPVIATDIAGIPDQVVDGETGYLIPTGDPDALRDRIADLVANPERREQMGAAGQRRARARFSAEEMVERTRAVYEELLLEQS